VIEGLADLDKRGLAAPQHLGSHFAKAVTQIDI
jgi:hypothetical protein